MRLSDRVQKGRECEASGQAVAVMEGAWRPHAEKGCRLKHTFI